MNRCRLWLGMVTIVMLLAGQAWAAVAVPPSALYLATNSSTGSYSVSLGASSTPGANYVLEESTDNFATAPTVYNLGTLKVKGFSGKANGTYYYRAKVTAAGYDDSAYTVTKNIVVLLTAVAPSSLSVATASSTGTYSVTLGASSTAGVSYVLEESTDDFATAPTVYNLGISRVKGFSGKTSATYYYRAKAVKAGWADSAYTVTKNIVVTWGLAAPSSLTVPATSSSGGFVANIGESPSVGVSYVLEEASDAAFTTNFVSYALGTARAKAVSGKYGTLYYRAKVTKAGFPDSAYTATRSIAVANSSACNTCHASTQTAWAAARHGNGNSNPNGFDNECSTCHGPTGELNAGSDMAVTCTSCHTPSTADPLHPATTVAGNVTIALCRSCHDGDHTGKTAAIGAKVAASPHGAATGHTTGTCQRCHTTQGSLEGASRGFTGSYSFLSSNTATLWTPAPTGATDGIACSACHDSHTGGMRAVNTYSGGTTVAWDPNGNAAVDQYDTCTGCHTLTDNSLAVVGNYHNGSSINVTRTISDSHYDDPATGVGLASNVVEGYNVRKTGASPCADCHDVHAADLTIQEAWADSAHAGKIAIKKDEAACAESITWFNTTYPGNAAVPVDSCTDIATVGTSTRTVLDFFGRSTTGIAFYASKGAIDDADGNAWTHYNWDNSTGNPSNNPDPDRKSCQRCHTATGASNFLNNPSTYNAANNDFSHLSGWTAGNKTSPQNELLYCWGCHSDVANGVLRDPGAITENYAAATTGGPVVTVTYPNIGPSNVCMSCHLGREVGANVATDIDADGVRSFINSHYLTAGATVFGESGYEYAGRTYSAGFHQNVGINNNFSTGTAGPCVTCHMTGAEPHTFEVLTDTGNPASPICAQCHTGLDATKLNTARSTFDTALHELQLALESKGIYYSAAYPYFYAGPNGTGGAFTNWAGPYGLAKWKDVMGAAYNYNLFHHDPGAYAHNRQYALDLIADSIDFIVDGVIDGQGGTFLTAATENIEDGNHVAFAATDCTPCHTSGLPGPPTLPTNTAAHALTGVPTVSNVQFTVSGADLVLTYNLKLDGVNATGFTVVNRDYRLDSATGDRLDLGAVTTAVDNGGGNYAVTLPGAAANANSRYLLRVTNTAGIVRALVVGDYPAAPVTSLAADSACTDCHGTQSDLFHYSYPVGQAQCVVCHDAANTTYPRFVTLGHSIHNSHNMASGHFELDAENTFSVTFPTYMNNCANCHRDPAALATVNAEPVSYNFCMTCHGDWDGWTNTVVGGTLSFHRTYTAATNCAGCHNGIGAPATIAAMHNGQRTERSGLIWDGKDMSVVEGSKIDLDITSITRSGNNLLVNWTASYDGTPVNPCNTTVAAGAPIFHAGGAANAGTGQSASNFSFIKGFAVKEDFVQPGIGTSPGQPGSAVNITTGNTTCSSNVATTTVALTATEQGFTMGRIGMQGKAQVKLGFDYDDAVAGTQDVIQVRSAGPTRDFLVADGSLPVVPRREVVDTASCLKCHPGSLYQHGGNRIDNVELCIICHNEASSEQNVRLLDGVDQNEAYDKKPGQTYGFKSLLHAVHSAGHNEAITMVHRTNGNYVWSGHATVIPNYPTADIYADDTAWGEQTNYWLNDDPAKTQPVGSGLAALVYGSSAPHGYGPQTDGGASAPPVYSSSSTAANYNPAYPAGTTYTAGTTYQVYRNHNLHQTTYPQVLNNCLSCHKAGTFGFPDASKAVATTVDAGPSTKISATSTAASPSAAHIDNSNLSDDIVRGPAAAACFSCHQGVMAPPVSHGNVGGFAPANFGDRTSVPAESCAGCHTP
ncbi:MAG: hypothetical protein FDZ69_10570 [Deltaproteobacteria bacterium]|nr:MAG: hypothetical protein FDZ69_10570 [Deltaproteobacteria bacterium]